MKPLRYFEEFLEEGIVKKQTPDILRARSLMKESEETYFVLKEIITKLGLGDKNANYIIKNSYDVIMELIRAKMILEGFNSSGQGIHEAEVSYLRELDFNETEIEFANQLRYFRNGILYYGKSFDAEYAQKVLDFLEKIYRRLKKTNI
ncbi:MAG: hypothetical protein ABH824_04155 [Nanoarchaeota archaeon]|nr:hypothetical protein [Nanoarchaeota archaeon]MBU1632494.1 hypothetical protein [Nanoarchaeota archaeon]MBU1876642.1 hypothetical protein [Nanoarchaeota archaeon]